MNSNSMEELKSYWANFGTDQYQPDYFHYDDRDQISSHYRKARSKFPIEAKNWIDYMRGKDWGIEENRLHKFLLPMPFIGNLKTADIFFVLWNPGVSYLDYMDEENPSVRSAILRSINQNFTTSDIPFHFLDPQYAQTSGFRWWNEKVKTTIAEVCKITKRPYGDVLRTLGKRCAAIEIVAYRSGSPPSINHDKLESSRLAINAVLDLISNKPSGTIVVFKGNTRKLDDKITNCPYKNIYVDKRKTGFSIPKSARSAILAKLLE